MRSVGLWPWKTNFSKHAFVPLAQILRQKRCSRVGLGIFISTNLRYRKSREVVAAAENWNCESPIIQRWDSQLFQSISGAAEAPETKGSHFKQPNLVPLILDHFYRNLQPTMRCRHHTSSSRRPPSNHQTSLNEDAESQAMDRIHRINQTRKVTFTVSLWKIRLRKWLTCCSKRKVPRPGAFLRNWRETRGGWHCLAMSATCLRLRTPSVILCIPFDELYSHLCPC